MSYENVNKTKKIKSTLRHLADRLGEKNFKIKDHWTADLNAIGLVDSEENYLVYISTYGGNDFFVSLENLKKTSDHPYEPAGDFETVDLEKLEQIIVQHLRIDY